MPGIILHLLWLGIIFHCQDWDAVYLSRPLYLVILPSDLCDPSSSSKYVTCITCHNLSFRMQVIEINGLEDTYIKLQPAGSTVVCKDYETSVLLREALLEQIVHL